MEGVLSAWASMIMIYLYKVEKQASCKHQLQGPAETFTPDVIHQNLFMLKSLMDRRTQITPVPGCPSPTGTQADRERTRKTDDGEDDDDDVLRTSCSALRVP
jgi:hypothetical protein